MYLWTRSLEGTGCMGFVMFILTGGMTGISVFSRSNYSAASAQPDRSAGLAKTWSRQRQIRVPKSVSVDNLVKFFQNPAKVFLQDTFGISLPPEPVEILESECFWPEPLVGYEIRKAIFDGIIEGQDMDTVAERLYGSGLVTKN